VRSAKPIKCGEKGLNMAKKALKVVVPTEPLKLDLCCGSRKQPGFIGVDRSKFDGVDIVHDLMKPWPWADESVAEIHMSHALEHFGGEERVFIFNEMYRVMQTGAKVTIITPLWSSNRAYGDFTHKWPPVSEMLYYYLDKTWRMANAPDTDISWNPKGYKCDFANALAYNGIHAEFASRADVPKMFALSFYKEAAGDLMAVLTKK
jgi:hypothetical protein